VPAIAAFALVLVVLMRGTAGGTRGTRGQAPVRAAAERS
jgi:hypothetical protein